MKQLVKGIAVVSLLVLGSAAYASSTQQAIGNVQKQIQQVSNSIPVQIEKAQTINRKQLAALQAQMQQQVIVLQKQIQQVQDESAKQMAALQKEIHQLELMH